MGKLNCIVFLKYHCTELIPGGSQWVFQFMYPDCKTTHKYTAINHMVKHKLCLKGVITGRLKQY